MKRSLVAFGLATAIVLPVIGEAQAASEVAAPPAPAGAKACVTQPPMLLDPGAAPHARLRVRLAANANRSGTQFNTEHVRAKTVGPDGAIVPRESTQQLEGVYTTGRPAHGRLPVKLRLSIPGATGKAAAKLQGMHFVGFMDALNGGLLKAVDAGANQMLNDHLPREPIGIGTSWRVVNCDRINSTPARETRTYTLESTRAPVSSSRRTATSSRSTPRAWTLARTRPQPASSTTAWSACVARRRGRCAYRSRTPSADCGARERPRRWCSTRSRRMPPASRSTRASSTTRP